MSYDELVDWLFDRATLRPQLGFAGKDKRAWLWLPGAKAPQHGKIVRVMESAPLKGCTQLAYANIFAPTTGQWCEIAWVGLDIDAEDNPATDLTALDYPGASMVRTSCSGQGIHLIYRLEEPILCTHETANRIIKTITTPLVENLGTIKVCKADRRMFWLCGGKNEILAQSDERLVVNLIPIAPENMPEKEPLIGVTPLIAEWCEKLGVQIRKSTPVYIGDIIKRLAELGEVVRTRSGMRGNGQTNGYIDVTATSISLWSYADGHVIWNLT
ncbi:MAG TPA: hypothetical protein PKI71_00490, partial [Candidatus Rifleibacterium sp.]|nr:hypothetical protein [Candidatus Rifleibacterium sp.]